MISDSQILGSLNDTTVTVPVSDLETGAGRPAAPRQSNPTKLYPQELTEPVQSTTAAEVLTTEPPTVLATPQPVSIQNNLSVEQANLGGSWQSNGDLCSARFSFAQLRMVYHFADSIIYELTQMKSAEDARIKLGYDNGWFFDISLRVSNEDALQLVYLANYNYVRMSKSPHLFNTDKVNHPEKLSLQTQTVSAVVEQLSLQPQGIDAERRLIKVPFAVLGKWQHDEYGIVEFTQADFDQMKENFANKVVGFEPPLYLGHPITTTSVEGHPAEAFLVELVQEDNVLCGLFEAVSDVTYTAVSLGQYRYSSGEFIRNWKSKDDGQMLGTALIGVALTNRPFLPNMPRVKALSADQSSMALTFQLSSKPMSQELNASASTNVTQSQPTQSLTNPVQETPAAPVQVPASTSAVNLAQSAVDSEQFRTHVLTELQQIKLTYQQETQALAQQVQDTKQQLTTTLEQLSQANAYSQQLETRLKATEDARREERLAVKLTELQSLTLPQEVKDQYKTILTDGSLGDQEETVMETLRQMSATRLSEATTQHGSSQTTQALNSPEIQDPFKATIERNQSLAQKRQEQLENLLT